MNESESKRLHGMIKSCIADFGRSRECRDQQDVFNAQTRALEMLEKNYTRLLAEMAKGNANLNY